LAATAAGAPARVDLSSVRLQAGPDGPARPVDAEPLEGLAEDPRQPTRLSWVSAPEDAGELCLTAELLSEEQPAGPPPFPRVQFTPQPGRRLEASVDGAVVLAYHYDPDHEKPYCHPFIGPAGVALTRMGLPTDAEGRTHRHGLWLAYRDLDGENFWDDRADHGRQRHQSIRRLTDGVASARLTHHLTWESAGGQPKLTEQRHLRLWALPGGERLLDLSLELRAGERPVRFGRSPFGFLGARVARTMAVAGGGRVTTATGARDEAGALHQRARWCDYSGPVAAGLVNGLAIFDHDANLHHPCYWQVRDDGWMGAAPCYESGCELPPEGLLTLRYRLLAHAGAADEAGLAERYDEYVDPPRVTLGPPRLAGRP